MTRLSDWSLPDWPLAFRPTGDTPPLESEVCHKPPKFTGGKK